MPESAGGEPLQPAQPSASGGASGGPSGEPEPPDGEASVEITASRYQEDIFEVKNIGSGSFGCAILVEARSTGERFVAKKITFEHLTPEEQLKAQNEAALLKSFTHVNITEYLGSFVIGNVLHIIMEYCSGGDLWERIAAAQRERKVLPAAQSAGWLLQIIAALRYLHSCGIMHRDVKPENIFITEETRTERAALAQCTTAYAHITHLEWA